MLQFFASIFVFMSVFTGGRALAESAPVKVPVLYDKLYAPGGFDSNDHIQIVGEGLFRNACYRSAGADVAIDEGTKTIRVNPVAYEYTGFCLQVVLPFDRVMDVGILPAGKWQVVQGDDQSKKLGEFIVRRALRESPDDYLYAPISQAFYRHRDGRSEITVTGSFSNSCLSLQDVRTSVEGDVIVVQPIAALASRAGCSEGKFEFSRTITMNQIEAGHYLLHVRSMNGKAVNSLIDVN